MKTIEGAAPAGASSVIFDGTTGNIPELKNLQLLLDSARREYIVRNRWLGFWRERRVPVGQVATLFIRQGYVMGGSPWWFGFRLTDGSELQFKQVGLPSEAVKPVVNLVATKLAMALPTVEESSGGPDARSKAWQMAVYLLLFNAFGLGAGVMAYVILTDRTQNSWHAIGKILTALFLAIVAWATVGGSWHAVGKECWRRWRAARSKARDTPSAKT